MYNLSHATILLGGRNLEKEINHPKHAISPVIVEVEKGKYKCLGTCFFISETGIFITADHVLEDTFPEKIPEEKKLYLDEDFKKEKVITVNKGIIIPQLMPNNKVLFRKVLWTSMLSMDDTAIGVVEPMINNHGEKIKTIPLVLSVRDAKEGDTLFTYSYPGSKTFNNSFHITQNVSMGKVTKHYPQGRDRTLIPFPCYETRIITKGGSSGGPVFNLLGAVVGINTSGVGDTHFVSKINNILTMQVPGGGLDKMIKIEQLCALGEIPCYMWDSKGNVQTNVNYEFRALKPELKKST